MPSDGICYANGEVAFQAQKENNPEKRRIFFSNITNPVEAKRLGRKVCLPPNWEATKVQVMRQVQMAKYGQNRQLKQMLLATGDAVLVEANTWGDKIWGVDATTGEGKNHLGEILMELRKE